jgi:hypothetical protein
MAIPCCRSVGVVGDWSKYPTWACHTVGAEISALFLIHYITYAQELDSFLKVLIRISVAFHLMLSSCSCFSSSDTVIMAKVGGQVSREWVTVATGIYGFP